MHVPKTIDFVKMLMTHCQLAVSDTGPFTLRVEVKI